MSRSNTTHHRHQQKLQLQQQQQQQQQQQLLAAQQQEQMAADTAATELFDYFCLATTMRQVLGLHRDMCDLVGLRPGPLNEFYPKLKQRVRSWKAQALWKKFDARAAHRAYAKGTACTGTRVLVIGAGPCGLRTAIEAQLLGAKVVVIEKRDRISRNNVLHLWPFVITDLRNLGAKKFYGKFCAGSIDHISIRQLQCILLKVALLLGVEVHEGVSFDRTIEPSGDGCGWRAAITPADHVVSHYEFDVLIGADGKRNTLEGFKRKEFRGKLAIAITANFINKKTEAEAKAEEISGVAFIFNQSFFKELYHTTGIDLENIVYYKDETHYFVMTAKKHSLIDKGVILQDFADPACLLAPANVSREKLLDYAREAAEFSTKYQMPNLEFAVNHYGRPDVAMFDFTSMFAAETSCRCIVRKGFRLLQCLVGDSLLEPFWPTGSGCARGFLSSMDAAYALKLWSNPRNSSLAVLAQRESIYRLLNQTTPENLQRDIGSYTVDPATRYPNLNRSSVNAWQVKHLVDTDDATVLDQTFMDTNALQPPTQVDSPMRRKRRSGDSQPLSAVLLRWISAQLHAYEFAKDLKEVSDVFSNGRVLCALINRYRPDLVDYAAVKDLTPAECNEIAFNILDKELHIPRVMSGKESMQMNSLESKVWLPYLEQVCETFRGEIPHVKHPKMDFSDLREKYRLTTAHVQPDFSKLLQISTKQKMKAALEGAPKDAATTAADAAVSQPEEKHKRHRREMVQNAPGVSASGQGGATDTPRRAKKRRSAEKTANIEERQKRLQEIEQNRQDRMSKRRQQRYKQTQNFYTSLHMLQANTLLRESADDSPFEDYSIFLYRQQAPEFNDRVKDLERKLLFPDRDRGDIPSALPRSTADEQFSDRIKSMEQRISSRNNVGTDKKPKDLMRAIGKIDSSDWNVREIEKKIEQSKRTEIHGPKGREKVPKWSKEQFVARQTKMSKPIRQDSREEEKFREIDQTIRNLDKQLKEGSVLEVGERGRNKVASIAGQFVKKDDTSDEKNQPSSSTVAKSTSKVALNFKKQAASEKCHFCKQTVYLMEKITTENLILHRSCLKCHHCHTNLRPGGYAFDRDDPNGRFYCTQHFRLPAKAIRPVVRKPGQRKPTQQQQAAAAAAAAANVTAPPDTAVDGGEPKTPEKLRRHADNVAQLDLLDRGQTPERIEFENTDAMSDGEPSEEHIIDEHEWSGRNFLPESNNDSESDLSSSDESDTESDSDMFEEANDSPLGAQTLQLASDWIGKQNYSESDDSDDFYDSSEGIADDDGKDDTEGEEFKKARELRRQEVRLLPLPANLPTDTETEVQSESESSSQDEVELNSATEISTDSEFDHDEKNRRIREAPRIFIDDTHLRKQPTKVQVKSSVIATSPSHKYPSVGQHHHRTAIGGGSYLQKYQPPAEPPQPKFKPLVQVDPTLLMSSQRTPLQNPRPGDYLLNKTASTEGIASKKSLELKKRYLLGEAANGNKIQKSGSTSVLDSKIRSFQSNISECQKLLNPGGGGEKPTFLDRSKQPPQQAPSSQQNELMRSATSNIINELKVEITIQKASSTASTDNEKENVFVNSKNELNKGMEYSETVNTTLLENISKKSPPTPTNQQTIIETINLVSPDSKGSSMPQTPTKSPGGGDVKSSPSEKDSNKIIDLTMDSPPPAVKPNIPDVSKDTAVRIPDIIEDLKADSMKGDAEDHQLLLNDGDDEKADSPEKLADGLLDSQDTLQIQVPTIPWHTRKPENGSSTTGSTSCSSSNSSSIEDIQHYILDSTTSPDTNPASHQVPRVQVHDSSGTLMPIDSLAIDEKYTGPDTGDDVLPKPAKAAIRTTVVEDNEDVDVEPVTATPEPADCTVIEAESCDEPPPLPEQGPPLPEKGPPKMKPSLLRFDSRNENKIESLKHLPLIVDETALAQETKAVKPLSLNLHKAKGSPDTPTNAGKLLSPSSPLYDNDKTPTADQLSRCSDSENEATGTGQALTETELSDWTADDCISENFVDMEFANSTHNSGTIRRNKKKHSAAKSQEPPAAEIKLAPMVGFEGIDIDDIEFMDTGSEGSCAEAYSATNTALLRNRGYVEFIEPKPSAKLMKPTPTAAPRNPAYNPEPIYKPYEAKRDEKLGIDYIEQGAYILQRDGPQAVDLLKTPVNETPVAPVCVPGAMTQSAGSVTMTQSLTDCSTLNDLDEDSTTQATNTTVPTTPKLTTDESEGLTVVTSPLDSTSPSARTPTARNEAKSSSGSSSEKNPRTSQSTGGATSSAPCSSKATPPRQSSQETSAASGQQMFTEELSYQDCVRALQHKITQISNARDSLDSRKQRRKSSKGETAQIVVVSLSPPEVSAAVAPAAAPQTVIASDLERPFSQTAVPKVAPESNVAAAASPQFHKVPEIPTLTRKLEEITKERTKQKDLIHDLVMDKLQSKKQLNAEKRLHRSRQRALLTSGGGGGGGYTSGSSLSPTPKPCDLSAPGQGACSNLAHYHVSTAAPEKEPRTRSFSATRQPPESAPKTGAAAATYSSFKENNPLQKSHTYVSAYGYSPKRGFSAQTAAAMAYKPRPFSEHIDIEHVEAAERYHLSKTPSFSYGASRHATKVSGELEAEPAAAKDVPAKPLRKNRNDGGSSVSASTESLRCEARARARLKSNSELGLSPEEKMQQLRRRLYEEHLSGKGKTLNSTSVSAHTSPTKQTPSLGLGPAGGLSECERKISASKSVNDLAYGQQQRRLADEKGKAVSADFTTQPSLLMAPNAAAAASQPKDGTQKVQKSGRRTKDPERRKSLIKSLSSFFHMGSSSSATSSGSAAAPASSSSASHNNTHHHHKDKQGASGSSAAHSAAAERPGPGGSSSTASGSNDGVFSLFSRISPKHKSKDKDGNPLLPDGRSVTQGHERTSSQDCLNACTKARNNTQHTNKHSSNNTAKKQHQQNTSTTTTTTKAAATPKVTGFSSSSPQLYMPKSSVNTTTTTTTKYHTSTAKSSEAHTDELMPPPIPPLPLNYQRSDDESYATETRDQKKQRAITKAVRQAELKRLRIAQEIQREQEEIEVQLKELEARGVHIEKALRGEGPTAETPDNIGHNDERLLKELLEIWRNITQLKKRDEELGIRQQELQLEHRHAQLKEELNLRLSCNKLDKSSADVAAEGAILNEMLEIVAKRAALRPTTSNVDLTTTAEQFEQESGVTLQPARGLSLDIDESNI